MNRVLRYFFCEKDFLTKLKNDGVIKADYRKSTDHNVYAYEYMFKKENINNGNGMFFTWKDPTEKGYDIEYDTIDSSTYALLELDIPENECIDTDYQNWCSFIMDLHEADGDHGIANEIALDYGVVGGLKGSYDNVFHINEHSNIQTLIPYISYDWIRNIRYTKNKIV